MIGAGGVIRDCNGNWYHDYMRNVRKGVVLQTWGLLSGFQIAKEFDIEHIIVESDSVVLISLIHSSDLIGASSSGTLLSNCKKIMDSFGSCFGQNFPSLSNHFPFLVISKHWNWERE